MISFPYNFFFFSSNHALLSSKKTKKSTKLSFKNEIGAFDGIFWQNAGRYTRVFATIVLPKSSSKGAVIFLKLNLLEYSVFCSIIRRDLS